MSSIANATSGVIVDRLRELVEQTQLLIEENLYFPGVTSLQQAGNYALRGGKRIRPTLSLALSRHYGLEDTDSLPILLAVELGHTASLILDDLPSQDNDSMRRGKPTLHTQYGVDIADLTSHYLREQGVKEIQRLPPEFAGKIQLYSADTVQRMCDGQDSDLHPPETPTLESLKQQVHLKTGLGFEGALWPISVLARRDHIDGDNIKDMAYHFGQAYQLRDDIIDPRSGTGKDIGSDKRNGRVTFVSLLGVDGAQKELDKHVCIGVDLLNQIGDIPLLSSMLQVTATRSK